MRGLRIFRRSLAAFVALSCAAALSGCSLLSSPPAAAATPSNISPVSPISTASPMPSPSPAPEPYLAVFGAEASDAFQQGVSKAAETGKYPVVFEPGGVAALADYQPKEPCVAILYLNGAETAVPHSSVPVFVFAADGQRVGADVPHLTYADAYAAETALDLAVAYPPHETPVRLIGLFTSEQSRAYTVWREAADNGRVFSKAELFLTEPVPEETPKPKKEPPSPTPIPTLEERLTTLLSRFYPGMIDGVYAATGELAVAAAGVLASLGRDDMEVFAASTSANAESLLSPLLVACVGLNAGEAGGLSYSAASALMDGETVSPFVVLPQTFLYSPNP
ncbi:MAG: hypothetical protein VB091_10615 [Christensenella sp.]|nr:hypothetical protein [Christensenella sp.]